MRFLSLALFTSVALAPSTRAADPRHFEDAPLHAIQFVDQNEGWAVGDEGVVWHSIDSGRTWERQPTGVRASLRSIHFLNPYTGWIAGREELPQGGGSVGVVLFTQDGGLRWKTTGTNIMPGLNLVRFLDNKTGFLAGDATDQFPSGVFATADSGRTWKPVPGPRCPGWLAGDFQDGQSGALAGPWSRLSVLRDNAVTKADVDYLGGRNLRGLHLSGSQAVAVGQGGLVLLSVNGGGRWRYAELKLPTELLAAWDFHGVYSVKEHIWVVGRPGSALLHSGDRGQSWETLSTEQPLPLNAVFFQDESHGWAVGELGSILATVDGGKSWKVQRRGGQRAAVLFVHARPTGFPVDTVAVLGGQEGYLATALRVSAPDSLSAAPAKAWESQRFSAASRMAGGAAGEMLWQFPVPQHLARADRDELLKEWDRLHGDQAAPQLLRQLVLTLRTWRPDVVITDHPEAAATGFSIDALVAEAVQAAITSAGDAKAFPEQIKVLGLEPWQVSKLYGRWESKQGAQVELDLNEASPALEATVRDFAAPAADLLADFPPLLPAMRYYHLLDSRLPGAAKHRDLMEGITLTPGGVARREQDLAAQPGPTVLKTIRARRNLEVLAENPPGGLAGQEKVLAQLGPSLAALPDDQGAAAALAIGTQYVRTGQWSLAREVFRLMVERYPTHPRTADAYKWLILHQSSSEAHRRGEQGKFIELSHTEFGASLQGPTKLTTPLNPKIQTTVSDQVEQRQETTKALLDNDPVETREWFTESVKLGDRLAALGPLYATDPALQFSLMAARRNLGEFELTQQWYARFRKEQPDSPWRDAAAAEIWLVNRGGPPPRPVALCRRTETKPFLDGNLEDPCWQGLKALVLRNAVGDTAREYPTEAWLAYDKDFLYLALRCRHPAGKGVAPVKARPRDADLRPYDRVSLLLDLDRDYSTYYHLQVDQRGCVCEDCWGDRTWNPRWFVAVKSDDTSWQIEAAIPLTELTGQKITLGHAWACNVVRVLPGRGVQAWSSPADVQPRPEGMGLLMFTQDTPRSETRRPPSANVP